MKRYDVVALGELFYILSVNTESNIRIIELHLTYGKQRVIMEIEKMAGIAKNGTDGPAESWAGIE